MNLLNILLQKSEEIANATKENFDVDLIEKYYSAYSWWSRASSVPSRPIFDRAWFEANILAETSIFLSIHGFYEQACATLRMETDSFLTRLYWDTLDKKLETSSVEKRLAIGYWDWESGKVIKYPKAKDIWESLKQEKYFGDFTNQYKLKDDFDNHSKLLHKYIHGRPPSRHTSGNSRSSNINIKFAKKEVDEWFVLFKNTYDLMSIMSILLYPHYLKHPSWREFVLLPSERLNQLHWILGSEN